MSTSTSLAVAIKYSARAESGNALLLRLRTRSFMQRGASMAYLSCFPEEATPRVPRTRRVGGGAREGRRSLETDVCYRPALGQEEYLFPPLTYLNVHRVVKVPLGEPYNATYTVVEAVPDIGS